MTNPAKILISPKGLRWFSSGHPWIYAGDLLSKPEQAGVVTVCDSRGKFLAQAFYSPHSKIALRILSRKEEPIDRNWFFEKLKRAITLRKKLSIRSDAQRLVFAESDGIPSLIVDRYGETLVVQTLSAGLEACKVWVFDSLKEILSPTGVFEKNDVAVRHLEKLPRSNEVVFGEVPETIWIEEAGLQFAVDVRKGQKTGAFLDQRGNRILAGEMAEGNVLDAFSYEGWFACHFARKAESVVCLESSEEAAVRIRENAKKNGMENKISIITSNAFDVLKEKEQGNETFGWINLDPPAFVKTAKEKEGAWRGYKEINLRAMKMLKKTGGGLSTSSCSYHMGVDDFSQMLAEAAFDAKAEINVFAEKGAAPDHPMLPGFPESRYLKCLFCYVNGDRYS